MAPALKIYAGDERSGTEPNTLDWFADRYREDLHKRVAADDYSPRRLKGTMSYVESFLHFVYHEDKLPPVRIGSLPPELAKQIHLREWLVANYHRWKKGSTRADALGAVLGCFNWAEDQELIVSPFRRPRNLKFPRTHFRAMRKHHYRAVMDAARKCKGSKAFRLIFFAAWNAGVRLGEFRRLEPHEIDWAASVVRLPPEKNKTGRKTGEARIIGLGPHLLSVLRGLCRTMKAGQKYVFLSPRGRPWTKDMLGRKFRRYRKLADVKPDIKMCAVRHGFAVRVLADGTTSNKAVADLLGHKSTRMVDAIYGAETRYDASQVRQGAAKAERGRKAGPRAALV